MSSCRLLLGCPLDLFPLLGCHSVQHLVHQSSFILVIWPAHFHFCFSVYSMISVIFVLFLISEHGILSCSFRSNIFRNSNYDNNDFISRALFNMKHAQLTWMLMWGILILTGVRCPETTLHAAADWLWRRGRRHHHCSAAQQPQTAWETHHWVGNRDFCQSCPWEEGVQVKHRLCIRNENLPGFRVSGGHSWDLPEINLPEKILWVCVCFKWSNSHC